MMRALILTLIISIPAIALFGQQVDQSGRPIAPPQGMPRLSVSLPVSDAEVDLRKRIKALTTEYSSEVDDKRRAALRSDLRDALSKQFDILTELNFRQINELEAALDKLREQHKKRILSKEHLTNTQADILLDEAEGLNFSPGAVNIIKGPPPSPRDSIAINPRTPRN